MFKYVYICILMSSTTTLFRIYCITESQFTYGFSTSALTTCPNNVAHTVQAGSSTVVSRYNSGNLYSIGNLINYTVTETTRSLAADAYYQNLIVPVGITLATNGYRIFVAGTLTLTGIISANGGNASGITAGASAAAGTLGGSTQGGNGSNASGTPGSNGGSLGGNQRLGGLGGAGGAGASAGGASGTAPVPVVAGGGANVIRNNIGALIMRDVLNNILYGGIGGGGGGGTSGSGTGGGGGAGGGVVVVAANKIVLNGGTITALGGAGANATGAGNAGGGGGGGGGVVIVITSATLSDSTFISCTPGNGGSKTGGGVAGSTGGTGYSAIYYV